ncbi:hypothetical protein ABT061_47410 [Streptosporangium sp. NPDC002544]|uniref:trypsin-like serine peptidase n=1 Tax=Streptosporangium sp. NPDC002544 TaxID=3154538 RepID=UPI003333F7B8
MRRLRLIMGALLLAGTVTALPAAASADPDAIVSVKLERQAAAFWTPERMAQAKPAELSDRQARDRDVPPVAPPAGTPGREYTVPGAPPARQAAATASQSLLATPTVGAIYLVTADGGLVYCSASAVGGHARNVIATAAHCLHGGPGGGFIRSAQYIPYYNYGPSPEYGVWTIDTIHVHQKWINTGDDFYDFAFATVAPRGDGARLGDVTGYNGMSFNRSGSYIAALWGYPGIPPSNAEWQYNCTDIAYNGPMVPGFHYSINCSTLAHGGSSGGPWIYDYQQERRWGYVSSVITHGVPGKSIYGPALGDEARAVYERATGQA